MSQAKQLIEFNELSYIGVLKGAKDGYKLKGITKIDNPWMDETDIYNSIRLYTGPNGSRARRWGGNPKFRIWHDNTWFEASYTTFIFSSGSGKKSLIADHYFVVFMFTDGSTSDDQILDGYMTEWGEITIHQNLPSYYSQCKDMFRILTENTVPQLLIALAFEFPDEFKAKYIHTIQDILTNKQWNELEKYKDLIKFPKSVASFSSTTFDPEYINNYEENDEADRRYRFKTTYE